MMRKITLLSMLVLLALSACAPPASVIPTAIAPTAAAPAPDLLTGRLMHLLEEGSTLTAMTIQGTTFDEFRLQLARAKGAYSLALGSQSAGRSMSEGLVETLNLAFTGWDLGKDVWSAKLSGGEAPRAPDVGRYADLERYVGIERLPFVESGSGPVVDQDAVIQIVLGLAMEHFGRAQALVLEEMR